MSCKRVFCIIALITLTGLFAASVSAQFTITIPKIPKIKKPEPKPTPQPTTETESPQPKEAADNNESEPKTTGSFCSEDWWIKEMAKDIAETRKEAEEFRPGRDYYVSTLSDGRNKFMEAALSPWERKEWFADAKLDANRIGCMNPLLDDLAAVAKKTLPTYTGPSGYTLGTPAEKKLLLSAIDDIARAKVFKVGILQPNWLISKDSYNFPTARYKHGVIIAKYSDVDFTYCRLFWVNLVQDYAGGGTYGASYGNYISRAFAGCPAGK